MDMPLITLEDYAEKHNLDPNYLHLLVAAGRLPHQRIGGQIYVNDQFVEIMEEEQMRWVRAWKKMRR